jgi:hypothetical protein
MLDAVQDGREPWQRMFPGTVQVGQAELAQSPVGNVTDVGFDVVQNICFSY